MAERSPKAQWKTITLPSSRASPPIPAQAFTDFDVESLIEFNKIQRESTPTRERCNQRRATLRCGRAGRLLRIWMIFVNEP
jgi:hypothetical protein